MSKYGRIRVETCFGNPLFKKFAQDQVYLDELKKVHRIWFALWWVSSKCGQSFGLLAFWTVIIACLFGITYAQYELPESWLPYFHWIELPGWFSFLYDWYSPVFQNLSASTWFTPYYFSIVTLTTSGYGDVTPQNLTGEIWVTTEIILGYVLLGVLISVFVNKIARRS